MSLEARRLPAPPRGHRRPRDDDLHPPATPRAKPQDLLVDVAVHFVKARGVTGAKVVQTETPDPRPREHIDLQTSFSLAIHTTRVPQPGVHAVDVLVNRPAHPRRFVPRRWAGRQEREEIREMIREMTPRCQPR